MTAARCINLDWLEVYSLEPITQARDMEFFRSCGFGVIDREYGTRIYEEMFTLIGADNHPFLEVRRKPKNNSILPINACHLRFVNRTCYYDNAGQIMQQFLDRFGYTFISISRIDICLDFEKFDSGDEPQKFLKRYIAHKYSKINQSQAHTHFDDLWSRRDFNSFSWGAKNSDIGTKMYNKTLELYDDKLQSFRKPYILQAWFLAGLIDDPVKVIKHDKNGQEYRPTIWRLEFSIRSNTKGWFTYWMNGDCKVKRSVKNILATYQNRAMLLPIFDLLQQHYFHFKKYQEGRRKYDCPDKVLFKFGSQERFYRVDKPASANKPGLMQLRLLRYLKAYLDTQIDPNVQKAGNLIIEKINKEDFLRFGSGCYGPAEYEALKRTIALRCLGNSEDPVILANDILTLLKNHEIF